MSDGDTPASLSEMPCRVASYLRQGALGIVMTVGEDGYPTDAFAWVVATDSKTVRFGADHGSKTLGNLQRDGRVAVQIIGPDNLVFLIKGETRCIKDDIDAVPMGIQVWEIEVTGATDQASAGVVPFPLAVQWSGENREQMVRAEQAAFAEMREATA